LQKYNYWEEEQVELNRLKELKELKRLKGFKNLKIPPLKSLSRSIGRAGSYYKNPPLKGAGGCKNS
jgi:hypothetical protein